VHRAVLEVGVTVSLKYAHVERERRWLLATIPTLTGTPMAITDRYLVGTRLRLREVVDGESVVRKLGHKVRLDTDAGEVACTNFYLDDTEWSALSGLTAQVLRKQRWRVVRDGQRVAVDVFDGPLAGLVLAEIDRGFGPDRGLPAGFDVAADVTHEEAFTGAALAGCSRAELVAAAARFGLRLPD
jgi:CYTH domain-containing protein